MNILETKIRNSSFPSEAPFLSKTTLLNRLALTLMPNEATHETYHSLRVARRKTSAMQEICFISREGNLSPVALANASIWTGLADFETDDV